MTKKEECHKYLYFIMKFILQHYNSYILSVYGIAENAMTHKAVSL